MIKMKGHNPPTKREWVTLLGGGGIVLLVLFIVACTTKTPQLCDYSDECHYKVELEPGDHICCSEAGLTRNVWTENSTFPNMCCFPSNCPQAANNPSVCTCRYMVVCFKEPINNSDLQ
jgi:hypothetical protein